MNPSISPSLTGMTQITLDITMSVDGFVAGPGASLEEPLGAHGLDLHEWIFPLRSWRARHGQDGGETGPDDELVARGLASLGAVVMGRRMFSGGSGPWEDDPNAGGWWDDDPPFRVPVFVVTHHHREPVAFANGTVFHFVTEGVEAAVERAREAANGNDVGVGGGASVATQALRAGLLDRIELHIAPVLLGGGVKLFDGVGFTQLEIVEQHGSPRVTHVSYRVSG
jgi:dihydrofolate reductase